MTRPTEADMIDLLRQRYTRIRIGTTADRYVRITHARKVLQHSGHSSYTGNAKRILDYLVIDTYGQVEILGFEVKVSRADWLTELRDTTKAEEWRQHCHRFYLVVPDPAIVQGDLPDGWGLMSPGNNGQLRVRTQSAHNDDPAPLLDKWTMSQLFRSAVKTATKEEDR